MEVTFTLQFGKATAEILCTHCLPPVNLGITPPHNHRQGEVHVMLSGSVDYTIGEENRTFQSGDFVYIPPKMYHSAKAQQIDTSFITFTLRGGPKLIVYSSLPKGILDGIYHACKESGTHGSLEPLMPYFYILLGIIFRQHSPIVRENRDYEGMIMRHLDAHYNQNITLSSLAAYVGISPKQVQRIVQKETGHTFLAELTARRMRAAKYLEENTTMTSAEIAHYVGYNSYSGYWKARNNFKED